MKSESDNSAAPTRVVICPTCRGASIYASSNSFRPFCCERCRQIDLGAWASERFALPSQVNPSPVNPLPN